MKTGHIWISTSSSIFTLIGALPIAQAVAQAVETIEPYTPKHFQPAIPNTAIPVQDQLQAHPPSSFEDVSLSFDLPDAVKASPSQKDFVASPNQIVTPALLPQAWWTMGSNSPIAIAIGMAEGTRTLTGEKTAAYYWHQDPGNGANNFGTFSYQHLPQAKTSEVDRQASGTAKREVAKEQGLPELSDRLQLQRLQKFYEQLQQQAQQKGIQLTPLELLNGLDLANQSEAAALSAWGYVDRLAQMRQLLPNQPEEQIQEARTWAYWSPDRNTWDAPGLGNQYLSIRRDQDRRFAAIQEALKTYARL